MIKEFDQLINMCSDLNTTNSKLEKAEILATYPQCKELILLAMDPYKKYHVTSKNIEKLKDKVGPKTLTYDWNKNDAFVYFKGILEELEDGILSGHDAISTIHGFISCTDEKYREIVYNIIDKKLKTRMGDKEVNKVFPGLVPTFEVCLANKADEKQMALLDETYFIQRKLDGCRCVCRIENLKITFLSRKGIPFTTLELIAESLRDYVVENGMESEGFVIDGEICIVDEAGNEIFNSIKDEHGNEITKGIMSFIKKKDFTIPNPKYKMFDLLTLEEFDSMVSKSSYSERYNRLKKTFVDVAYTDVVDNVPYTPENFNSMHDQAKEENWEGLMLRKDKWFDKKLGYDIGYEGKRSNNLLKVKKFFDDEYEVLSIEKGDFRIISKETGLEETETMLSSVGIEHKGYPVDVGSGFSIEERRRYYDSPLKIIGNIITVQYFEETMNKKGELSLRFPTLKVIHGVERDT